MCVILTLHCTQVAVLLVCVCLCVHCACFHDILLCLHVHRANDQSGMTRLKNVKSSLCDKKKEEDALDDAMERCKKLLGLLTEDDTHQRYPPPVKCQPLLWRCFIV